MAQLKKPSRRIIDFMQRKDIKLNPSEWYVRINDTKKIVFENRKTAETKCFMKEDYSNIYF